MDNRHELQLIQITGYDSYNDGAPYEYNPYQHGTPEYRAWSDGWYEAARQQPDDDFTGFISAILTVLVFVALFVVAGISIINYFMEM